MSGSPSSSGASSEAVAPAGTGRAASSAMVTRTVSPTLRTAVTLPTFTPRTLTAAPGKSPGAWGKTAVSV